MSDGVGLIAHAQSAHPRAWMLSEASVSENLDRKGGGRLRSFPVAALTPLVFLHHAP